LRGEEVDGLGVKRLRETHALDVLGLGEQRGVHASAGLGAQILQEGVGRVLGVVAVHGQHRGGEEAGHLGEIFARGAVWTDAVLLLQIGRDHMEDGFLARQDEHGDGEQEREQL